MSAFSLLIKVIELHLFFNSAMVQSDLGQSVIWKIIVLHVQEMYRMCTTSKHFKH